MLREGVLLLVAITGVACAASSHAISTQVAGFWYEADAFALPSEAAKRLNGSLDRADRQSIERISRAEIEQAFTDLRIRIVADDRAFWRVNVVKSLPVRSNRQLPAAGESLTLGARGGTGSVGLDFVVFKALDYAPRDAT